jgi:hypothetical protein
MCRGRLTKLGIKPENINQNVKSNTETTKNRPKKLQINLHEMVPFLLIIA